MHDFFCNIVALYDLKMQKIIFNKFDNLSFKVGCFFGNIVAFFVQNGFLGG